MLHSLTLLRTLLLLVNKNTTASRHLSCASSGRRRRCDNLIYSLKYHMACLQTASSELADLVLRVARGQPARRVLAASTRRLPIGSAASYSISVADSFVIGDSDFLGTRPWPTHNIRSHVCWSNKWTTSSAPVQSHKMQKCAIEALASIG